eukprot:1158781-Pelagomonas_calceolata.AAC.4
MEGTFVKGRSMCKCVCSDAMCARAQSVAGYSSPSTEQHQACALLPRDQALTFGRNVHVQSLNGICPWLSSLQVLASFVLSGAVPDVLQDHQGAPETSAI